MIRLLLVLMSFLMVSLVACSGESGEPQATAKPSTETAHAESWREDQMLEGKETYEAACASCHDTGEDGAPAIGDKDAWSDRSGLWVAVLSDHATAGYLNMPEKGGHGELTDESVSTAVEYMLLKTFPELPRD
jgi:cytochrome c oxidase cbb3-type subunit 3